MQLVNAFAELQKKNPAKERTLVGISTAALAFGEAGLLCGLGVSYTLQTLQELD